MDTSFILHFCGIIINYSNIYSANKTDCHDITEIWLKVASNTITLKNCALIVKSSMLGVKSGRRYLHDHYPV